MEKRSPRRGKTTRRVLLHGALLAAVGLAPAAFAFLVPGGGKPEADCFVELDLNGVTGTDVVNGKKVTCIDGDPCDADHECNGSCTFDAAVCVNQTDPALATCTAPAALSSFKVNAMGEVIPSPGTSGPNCSDRVDLVVALKGNKQKNGKRKIAAKATQTAAPKKDQDKYTLLCTKRVGACPTTTTTTLPPVCGDGTVGTGEQCDPPCGAGCAAGQMCDGNCQCVTQAACNCGGPPDPMQVSFVTGAGSGTCGEFTDAAGTHLVANADLTPDLNCGGLYFGGSGNAVPLPNSVPQAGLSIANVCCSGTTLTAIGATAAETGSERTCTAKGCLFGPPLPVVNTNEPSTSTCVLNRLASSARGGGDCSLGTSDLTAPLSSEIFLAGDSLFNCLIGDTTPPGNRCTLDSECGPGGVCPTGIQPCPICRGAPGSETCFGGPNNGMACVPGTTSTGSEFPTSHDCPPPSSLSIGSIPISFALSTGTVVKESVTLGTPRVFCGFCRDALETGCFEGTKRFKCKDTFPPVPCDTLGTDPACPSGHPCESSCPVPIGETHPCDSNDDCTAPYASCEQNQPGAFAPNGGSAKTIRLFGSPAGDARDRLPHTATLAGIFCIPPTYDPIIDNAGNLPGPGAVTLPGTSQLLPTLGP